MANRSFFRRVGLADEVAAPAESAPRRRRILRPLLLALGPVVVLAGALHVRLRSAEFDVHAGSIVVRQWPKHPLCSC